MKLRALPYLLGLMMVTAWAAHAAQHEAVEAPDPADAPPPASVETDAGVQPAPAEGMDEPVAGEDATTAAEEGPDLPGSVARSQFTSAVVDREPVDEIARLQNNVEQIYYFTELRDMKGQQVTHRWLHEGEVMAEVDFEIGGPRWRTWSKKTLVSGWTGEWRVQVINETGEVLAEDAFQYVEHVGGDSGGSTAEQPPDPEARDAAS
ncbi:MAG: DUF2914 domain-containing protein [Gammaproteobacteria bacterium]|nr:DUF2914 domain-containing protein [Gammaproteobacteria bacterium]